MPKTDEQKLEARLEELKATISQKEELLFDLENKKKDLYRTINERKKDVASLEAKVANAFTVERERIKNACHEMERAEKESKEKLNRINSDSVNLIKEANELERDKKKFRHYYETRNDTIEKQRRKNKDREKYLGNKERDVQRREEAVDKAEKDVNGRLNELAKRRDESYQNFKDINVKLKEVETLQKKLDSDKKIYEEIMLEIGVGRSKNLEHAGILDAQEKELTGMETKIATKEDVLIQKVDEHNDNVVEVRIAKEKYAQRESSLKAKEKDIKNRAAKLAEREKLFKDKIRGE